MPFFSQVIAASRVNRPVDTKLSVKSYRTWDYSDYDGSGTSDWDSKFSSSEGTATNTFHVGLPVYSAGDYCVICLANDETTSPFVMTASPTGWTRLTPANTDYGDSVSDAEFGMWGRQMDGTEGSSIDMEGPTSDSDSRQNGVTFTLSNVNSSNPVDVLGTTLIPSGTVSSINVPAATSIEGGLLFTFVAFDGSDGDPFSTTSSGNVTYDYSIDFDSNGTQNFGTSGTIRVAEINSATNTGSVTIGFSSTDNCIAGHVILK